METTAFDGIFDAEVIEVIAKYRGNFGSAVQEAHLVSDCNDYLAEAIDEALSELSGAMNTADLDLVNGENWSHQVIAVSNPMQRDIDSRHGTTGRTETHYSFAVYSFDLDNFTQEWLEDNGLNPSDSDVDVGLLQYLRENVNTHTDIFEVIAKEG